MTKIGNPLKKLLKVAYRANQPVILIGKHGLGKSEILKSTALELGIDFRVADLSLMEPCDLLGIPKIDGSRTIFMPPAFLPPPNTKGLLVFEEINRAPRHVRSPCLQLLTERKLNEYILPKGWLPMAAINPANEDYETEDLDPALLSRFMQVEVEPCRDEWLKWAGENGVNRAVLSFIEASPDIFEAGQESNPRAWTYLSNVVTSWERDNEEDDDDILFEMLAGLTSQSWAAAFLRFYKKQEQRPLTAEEIIKDFKRNKAFLTQWIKTKKIDCLKASWMSLKNYLKKQQNLDLLVRNKVHVTNVKSFVEILPQDLSIEAKNWLNEMDFYS